MPSILSSPVSYPQPSSPPIAKRPLPGASLTSRSYTIGAFIDGNSDNEEDFRIYEPTAKRRMLEVNRSSPTSLTKPLGVTEDLNEDDVPSRRNKPHDLPWTNHSNTEASNNDRTTSPSPIMPSFLRTKSAGQKEGYTCSGKSISINTRQRSVIVPYERA